MWFEGIAYAQAAAKNAGAGEQVMFTTVIPLVFLFGIFYFLLIRPQTRKAADLQKMLSALKRNDEVVTTGGMLGRIVELGDKVVTLEIAPNVRVRVERAQIAAISTYTKTGAKAGAKD
ncbi:MAG TPA: preprotein translocase subunit YajC [Candidatus Binataceae bacterium]|jgi:preprotein translocase subunit YajC|nr:preprotein translocase subunit YajC [Candidatus Binataceae bacterium]